MAKLYFSKRHQGNASSGSHVVHSSVSGLLRPGLRRALEASGACPPTPRAPAEPKRRNYRCLYSDDEVMRMRQQHEWLGMTAREVHARIGKGTLESVARILDYVNHAHGPEPGPCPEAEEVGDGSLP